MRKFSWIAIFVASLLCGSLSATTMISAEAGRTSNTVFRIRDACKYFFVEYGYFPPSDEKKLLQIIQGMSVDGYNWRKIVFWEPRPPIRKFFFWTSFGELDDQGKLIDGWGRPFRFEVTPEGFMIWSTGPEGKDSIDHALKAMRGTILIPQGKAEQGAAANP